MSGSETSDSGFGTMRHDIESYVGPDVGEVDVLRVNHHGSHHSSNAVFMAAGLFGLVDLKAITDFFDVRGEGPTQIAKCRVAFLSVFVRW